MNETARNVWYGVYRVLKNGKHRYCERSATTSLKLAQEIAADFSSGKVVMPDGSTHQRTGPVYPHIAREI